MVRGATRSVTVGAPSPRWPRRVRTLLTVVVAAVATSAICAALVIAAILQGWGRSPLAPRGDGRAFLQVATQALEDGHRGNAALVLVERGRVSGEHYASIGRPVGRDSLFQVASLSKWVTAWGVMRLVEAGELDLDAPVARYLTRWSLPESEYDTNGVTIRRLLSHTAGLTDGLGYQGFAPGVAIQSIEESLTRATDPMPGADGAVRVGVEPGSTWRYSGGGYTLLQLIVEEVSGEPFEAYMRHAVLDPLGMTSSTFQLDEEAERRVAEFYGRDGLPAIHYRFTATAAAGLYATAMDLFRFLQAHLPGENGEPPGRGVVSPKALEEMRKPHATAFGRVLWGLGPMLYAGSRSGGFVIGHDGNNAPAINAAARLDPATGDGIVVLVTGDSRLASALAGEWVFWAAGRVEPMDFLIRMERMLKRLGLREQAAVGTPPRAVPGDRARVAAPRE